VQQKGKLVSDLNFLIDEALRAHDIVVPFPQRDLHIRTGAVLPEVAAARKM
jgi:small-conductance mechanosensitive channel